MQKTSRCGLCYGFPTWTKKSSTEIGGWPALGRWSPWRMTKELPIVLEKPMASEDPSGWGWEGWQKVMVDHWAILSHGGISKMMKKMAFNCLLMWMTRFFSLKMDNSDNCDNCPMGSQYIVGTCHSTACCDPCPVPFCHLCVEKWNCSLHGVGQFLVRLWDLENM